MSFGNEGLGHRATLREGQTLIKDPKPDGGSVSKSGRGHRWGSGLQVLLQTAGRWLCLKRSVCRVPTWAGANGEVRRGGGGGRLMLVVAHGVPFLSFLYEGDTETLGIAQRYSAVSQYLGLL